MTFRPPLITPQKAPASGTSFLKMGSAVVLLTAVVATPFTQQRWQYPPAVTVPAIPPRIFARPPNLYPNPIPFNQQNWPPVNPIRYQLARSVGRMPDTSAVQAPFAKLDWLPATPVRDQQPDQVSYNANLYSTTAIVAPFAQLDWKSAAPFSYLLWNVIPRNPNIFSEVPFSQSSWVSVEQPSPAPPQATPYNVNTVTVTASPFSQTDWSATRFPKPRALDASQSTSINLLPDPTQFMLVDWSGSGSSSRPRAPDLQSYNQALYTVTVQAAPFSQTDWPISKSLKPAQAQAYPNIALQNSVVAAPFVPIDWSVPRLRIVNRADGSVGFQILNISVNASLAVTEANDTLSATIALSIAASSSPVESNDTLGATGALAIVAASAVAEAPDTLSADGVNGGINAALSVTEANDTLGAAGTVSGDVESGDGRKYQYGWKPWRLGPSRKKKFEEELEELEAFLKAVAVKPPLEIYTPIVYQGPLAAAFFESIEAIEQRRAINAIKDAQRREDDDEEALLLLLS